MNLLFILPLPAGEFNDRTLKAAYDQGDVFNYVDGKIRSIGWEEIYISLD